MKKILFVILLVPLLLSCDNDKKFAGTWQLQNPASMNWNITMSFNDDGKISQMTKDQNVDGQIGNSTIFTYGVSGDELEIKNGLFTMTYKVRWENDDKFLLYNDKGSLLYSRLGSSQDKYLENYRTIINPPTPMPYGPDINPYGPGPSPNPSPEPVKQQELCYTCGGNGQCKVCGGVGSYSNVYTDGRTDCKACNKTGKCWHCHGTGYQ